MNKKLRITITIALIIVSCGATYLINEFIKSRIAEKTNKTLSSIVNRPSLITSNLESELLNTYRFIKPFNQQEPQFESVSFNSLKSKLTEYIEKLKKSHKIISASVYLYYFGHGSSMTLNPDEKYTPGSMFKVVNLLYYLKLGEQNPGYLDKSLFNSIPSNSVETQTFNSKQIEETKEYSIKELLKYMISYSDNRATYLLKKNIDYHAYLKMITDLKIPMPLTKFDFMFITAPQYSEFFKILYNSSYLSYENSEFALSLLNQCDFKLGLLKGIPEGIPVAHKFGEAEVSGSGLHQLHESGLVYLNKSPYLITIMTKGSNVKDLPPVLSSISKMVYDDISQAGK